MPISKPQSKRKTLAELHAKVVITGGFRPSDMDTEDKPSDILRGLRELESLGLVLFVPRVGWIDSSPAIKRYCKKNGLDTLLGTLAG